MKKLILAVTLMTAAMAQSQAQEAGRPADSAADAVYARVLNVEALSWAWRIEKSGAISYQALARMSANWGRGEAVRAQLLAKVKETINNGEVRRLTVDEETELEAAMAEARAITGGSRKQTKSSAGQRRQKQAAIDAEAQEMLEAEAKYWARRIAVTRDITYNELKAKSDGWLRGAEISAELLHKVETLLQSGETPELTKAEQAKLDLGNKKIKELLKRA